MNHNLNFRGFPQPSEKSCLDKLMLYDFEPILQNPQDFTLSEEEALYFITGVGFTILSISDSTCALLFLRIDEFQFFDGNNVSCSKRDLFEIISSFYNPDIFYMVAKWQPSFLPTLLQIQERFFFPSMFPSLSLITNKIKFLLESNHNFDQDTLSISITHLLSFLNLSCPTKFPHDAHFYSPRYCILFILSFDFLHPSQFPIWDKILFELKKDFSQMLFVQLIASNSLKYFYPSEELLLRLFSTPELCSLAFKSNNTDYLPFCDVPKSIKERPECFS